MNNIFNVKQAAAILGLSTNTTYKYLNDGKIEAARGKARGTFRIPKSSLEKFLGSPIIDTQAPIKPTPPVIISNDTIIAQPTLAIKITRGFISICLILIILDVVINPDFSLDSQFLRLVVVAIFILLSYQFGGFVKKT